MQRRLRRLRPKPRPTPSSSLRLHAGHALAVWSAFVRECLMKRVRAAVSYAGATLLLTLAAHAQSVHANGDVAEFIVNFVRYTAWPADPSRKAILICYAHGGALAPTAINLEQPVTLKGLPVTWLQITVPAQTQGCDVVWLNSDVRPAPREWLRATSEKPVLTISNYADFTADGGIVGAYRVGADWRFEVSLEALQRSRLNIAAAALRLSQKPKATAAGESR